MKQSFSVIVAISFLFLVKPF